MRPTLAVFLALGLVWGSAPSLWAKAVDRGPSEPGIPLLGQLPALSPIAQIDRLEKLLAADPAARNVALALSAPELLSERRKDLEPAIGAKQLDALTALVVNLHIEARGDERVAAGLERLTQKIAPEGRVSSLDFGKWFDGGAVKEAAPATSGRLSPVVAWPVNDEPGYKRRVHTLGAENGRLLINGKPAAPWRDKALKDGVAEETFIHPNDPGLLVKIYSAPNLDGLERKSARVDSLGPLSAARASPKMIEHGEAPVDGRGRVYFYVQELINGKTLKDFEAEERPFSEVTKLFARMAQAGLAWIVPGPSQNWMLSHILIDQKRSGETRALAVGGAVEPGKPEELAAHYEMLLSVLYPNPVEPKREKKKTPAVPAKEAAPSSAAQRGVKALYDLLGLMPESDKRNELLLKIPGAAYEQSTSGDAALLLSLVSKVREKGGESDVYEKISEQAWKKLSRSDAVRLAAQWEDYEDVTTTIIRRWISAQHASDDGAATWKSLREFIKPPLNADWRAELITSLMPLLARGEAGEAILGTLKTLPASSERDAAILSIPADAYAKMASADIASIFSLFNDADNIEKVPEQAWESLSRTDAARLIKECLKNELESHARITTARWIRAHYETPAKPDEAWSELQALLKVFPDPEGARAELTEELWPLLSQTASGKALYERLSSLPGEKRRDRTIVAISAETYAKMSGREVAAIISLVSDDDRRDNYDKIAKEAWERMSQEDVESLVKPLIATESDRSAAAAVRHWMSAHQDTLGGPKENGEQLFKLFKLFSESGYRDDLVVDLPGAAYARMWSRDARRILGLVSEDGDEDEGEIYGKVPREAWETLRKEDKDSLVKAWRDDDQDGTAEAIRDLWTARQSALAKIPFDTASYEMVTLLPDSARRNELILKIPGAVYDKGAMTSGKILDLLKLLSAASDGAAEALYQQVPERAWRNLKREDVERLVKQQTTSGRPETGGAIMSLWLRAQE